MATGDGFLRAFPPDPLHAPVDVHLIVGQVKTHFAVAVPPALIEWWRQVGAGYFGERALYVFGDGERALPRESLVDWNTHDVWRGVFPPPWEGGPLFFAETCFGDQLGFRWEAGAAVIVLFAVDTFESFVVAPDFDALFSTALGEHGHLFDEDRLKRVRARLGPLPDGKHFAPIVSPLVGGSDDPANFSVQSPSVHVRTALHHACG